MHLHITIARVGTLIFTALLTITMLTAERTPANAETGSNQAGISRTAPAAAAASDLLSVPTLSAPEPTAAVLGTQTAPLAAAEAEPEPEPVVTAVAASAPVAVAAPPPAASDGSYVLASWYGPGFYGNRTACGQIYSPQILGVAHKTLPCGTLLVLSYGGRTVTVPVIDRGPYIAGRTLDLSGATKATLGCPDLCTLLMQYAR
ncbi:MAG: hypothetical protein NVS1B1_00850 [Candidatus Limnocylindrales bacterium]